MLYHLRHPLLALEKVLDVCSGTMLMQTAIHEDPAYSAVPFAKFHPFGIPSGPAEAPVYDPTVFWLPNRECVKAMTLSAGFTDVEVISADPSISIARAGESANAAEG